MRTIETLTWIVVAGVVLSYVTTRKATEMRKALGPSPSAQLEVDPTRWRHYGEQPPNMGDWAGNADRDEDFEVLALRKTLAFEP